MNKIFNLFLVVSLTVLILVLLFVYFNFNNVNKPIEVLLKIWYEMTLADKTSTKMIFL